MMLCFGYSTVYSQETGTIISSDPPGASITLEGEYNLSATTPCRLPDNVNGKFELKANMSGYESWSGDLIILPGQDNHFSFSLAPKTRAKAALRSLFLPGWGQYYAGLKEKAIILNISTIGFAIGTVLADNDFRRKREEYFTRLLKKLSEEEIKDIIKGLEILNRALTNEELGKKQ